MTREFSAGGVVFKKEDNQILWLVVKPLGSEKWRLPKGWIDKGESSLEAAKREVAEEAGVKAEALGKVGIENIFLFKEKKKSLRLWSFI